MGVKGLNEKIPGCCTSVQYYITNWHQEQEQKSDSWGVAKCITDVLNTFWHCLWSISEQTHDYRESISFI